MEAARPNCSVRYASMLGDLESLPYQSSRSERYMTQAIAQASVTSQTIAVEHIRISSRRPFAEVRRKLEGTVPKLDTGIAEVLRSGDQERAKIYEDNGPRLSIFEERDHGSLLQIWGRRRNAVQYEIGNPLTASKMTRHQLPAALYAATSCSVRG
jgi:hypothetical protein